MARDDAAIYLLHSAAARDRMGAPRAGTAATPPPLPIGHGGPPQHRVSKPPSPATRAGTCGLDVPGGEPAAGDDRSELGAALVGCRRHLLAALVFSLALNLLHLASPIYMMQVYDRVVSGGSEATLVSLTILLLVAFGALAGLDAARARLLTRAGLRFDRRLARRAVAAMMQAALTAEPQDQPLRDLDALRHALGGAALPAILDLPWSPIYLAIIFMLHSALGVFAVISAVILVAMAVVGEIVVRRPSRHAADAAARTATFTAMSLRNAEVVQAMGMLPGFLARWSRDRDISLTWQQRAGERAGTIAAVIRFLRLAMQSMILGLGAYLVIERAANPGAMFAASLLLGRMLQPFEAIVGQWRGLIATRGAFDRLARLLAAHPSPRRATPLPHPRGAVLMQNVGYAAPAAGTQILHGIDLSIAPGETICVVGPSGAGKSTFAKLLVGVLAPTSGVVRLDGIDQSRLPRPAIGPYIGYLPQDIELFTDSVHANIARFATGPWVDAEVVRAAIAAGLHEMILSLPDGYETRIGDGGIQFSGGWRQRIGLARAVFGGPVLVVLDEPSSNLDKAGDAALATCLGELKARGTSVVVVTHRPETSCLVDKVLVLRQGRVLAFGAPGLILHALNALQVPSRPSAARGRK